MLIKKVNVVFIIEEILKSNGNIQFGFSGYINMPKLKINRADHKLFIFNPGNQFIIITKSYMNMNEIDQIKIETTYFSIHLNGVSVDDISHKPIILSYKNYKIIEREHKLLYKKK